MVGICLRVVSHYHLFSHCPIHRYSGFLYCQIGISKAPGGNDRPPGAFLYIIDEPFIHFPCFLKACIRSGLRGPRMTGRLLSRTVPPKATRPYLRRQVPRPCGSGPYVWSNIPLSCTVTDSSAHRRKPTGVRGYSISVLHVARERQNLPSLLRQLSWHRPLVGEQLYARGCGLEQVIFTVSGKITCDMAKIDLIFSW